MDVAEVGCGQEARTPEDIGLLMRPAQAPSTVLMVDDRPANLALLTGMLGRKGYRVTAAASGPLALQSAHDDPPDLILLDINMPGMNGYEVCTLLKSDEILKDIPVIFLSALHETIDKTRAFGVGGVDYIAKPFQLAEVEARVATHLELRRQKRQLQEANSKLRELEDLRDSLVHMIVHDLRSPLTGIYWSLGLMRDDKANVLTDKSAYCVEAGMRATQKLIVMVSDVLDTSKMESGQMQLHAAPCDLRIVLDETIAANLALAEQREIRFDRPENPALVLADKDILLRVIQNLLTNALTFTREGGFVRLALAAAGDGVRVSVQDDGPGIAPEYHSKIFEKFAQVEAGANRQGFSTGLGLTFCKLAVEAHGGRIGVDSEGGAGSTFWFELPANAADLATAADWSSRVS